MSRHVPLLLGLAVASLTAGSSSAEPSTIVVYADMDDDDNDGRPDHAAVKVTGRAGENVRRVKPELGDLLGVDGTAARLLVGDQPLLGKTSAAKELGLQGVSVGESRLRFSKGDVSVQVLELAAYDTRDERVDLATSHASVSRVVPSLLASDAGAREEQDPDALYWMVTGDPAYLPDRVSLTSTGAAGAALDALNNVSLTAVNCFAGLPEHQCRRTPAIRAVGDPVDRQHPAVRATSLLAEVGGRIAVQIDGREVLSIRVGGPRQTALGPIERLRSTVKTHIVRASAGGSPPVGGTEAGAVKLLGEELQIASGLWGQCGVHFGLPSEVEINVVDPPPPFLLGVGCDLGLPASGGELRFRVDGQVIRVPTKRLDTPSVVAERARVQLAAAGFRAVVSANAKIARGALRTADVLVYGPKGEPARIERVPDHPLSSDATLAACIGDVDLSDGLTHFSDYDAAAGTLEERTLIKAFDDGDPTTIELFVIPSFARSGRIGESFIYADGASVRNAVIVDRAGIRAGARSHTLAHEIGHILLDMPGHPDDYGVDMPSTLMDADAADATIFGPRRLSIAECERALRQSGPGTPAPLLTPWPLYETPRPGR
ncbi:MAG TPA: hypothetical protein VFU02_21575 [Polyangiaceae bacterium]|nr:hypothetical protein [Polyangiaceae bacterium]